MIKEGPISSRRVQVIAGVVILGVVIAMIVKFG